MSNPRTSSLVSGAERTRLDEVDRSFASGPSAVPSLIAGLGDPSWTVRRAVVAALAALGDDAVGPLVNVLTGTRSDESVLAAAVEALVMSTGGVEGRLEELMAHPDPAVGADIAQVLGRRQRGAAVPALVRLAQHADDNVAVAAIEGLGRVGSQAAVEALLVAVQSGIFFRVFPAITVLGRSGDPRVVKPLLAMLDDVRYAHQAAAALGLTGDIAALQPLVNRLLASTAPSEVGRIAHALANLDAERQRRYGVTAPVRTALRAVVDPPNAARHVVIAMDQASDGDKVPLCALLGMLGDAAGLPALLALAVEGGPVGLAAQSALQELGAASEATIRAALHGAESEERKLLLPMLRSRESAAEIVACLDDEDSEVRAAAADALGRTGSVHAVTALFERLSDPSTLVVQSAVAAIQSLGSGETEDLALASARSQAAAVRRWGVRILAYFGYARALNVLLEAMSDDDIKVQEAAIQGLAFLDAPKARDALLNAARHSTPSVRAVGYRSLGQVLADARGEATLLRGLSDSDPWARYYACQSAGKLRMQPALATLIERLTDPAEQVRLAAVEALSHYDDAVAHQALEHLAASSDSELQQASLIGLGIARVAKDVVKLAMTSPNAATRLVAVSALSGFEEVEDTTLFLRASDDEDESVRNAAVVALAGRSSPEATAALIDLLRRNRPDRLHIQELLALTPGRLPMITEALDQADAQLAPLLTAALVRMQDPHRPAALIAALETAGEPARRAAAVTLGGVRTTPALEALRLAGKRDPDSEVRKICAAALASA